MVVPVPAGVENGQTVRMPVGRKEIFITFRVAKSDYFRRQGSDVHTDAKISLAQAALGGTIRVQGLAEDVNVHVKIDVPKSLDKKQKALLQAYAETEAGTPGTIKGFTYDKAGTKIIMEDPEGLVAEIRDALVQEEPKNGEGKVG